jgi:hypothetical protein
MSTTDPDQGVKTTDKMLTARLALVLDPYLGVYVARAKAGVYAVKRDTSLEQAGVVTHYSSGIRYNPYAGFVLGIRSSMRTTITAEYNFDFYEFPDLKKYQRTVAVNFGLSI